MYLSIIALPFLGSLVSGLLGRKVGVTGAHIVTCGSLIICSILISIAFYEVGLCGSPVNISLGSWLDSEFLNISWEFYFDQLTVSLGLAVVYCSTLIHIYSIDYLSTDPHNQRFFSYLSAFTGGMLILICGGNYFVMFVGWEAIGVVSYLLINFYFTRIQANKAAILAFTMNRGGDMVLSIGFFAIFAFFAGTCGLLGNDLKRIIAFSTISQLGYMMMAIGLSQYNVALMHTVNHAFFKALLFLGAGAVIHSFADQQDVRKMGGLIKFLPFTYSVMLTGSLSLLATPYLTGFYSKDLILELAYGQYNFSGIYAYILGTITAGITAFYSFRLISLVFLTTPNGSKQSYINSYLSSVSHKEKSTSLFFFYKNKENLNLIVIFLLLLLALFSIFFGFVFSDLFVGMGSDFFQNSIFMHPKNISLIEAEFSTAIYLSPSHMGSCCVHNNNFSLLPEVGGNNIFIKLLPAILSFTGALSAIILYHLPFGLFLINLTNLKIGRSVYAFLNGKYYFDVIYNHFIIQSGLKLGYSISKEIDRGAIELLGPYGLSNYFYNAGKILAKLDTGVITTYSLYITIALISLLFILFYPSLILAHQTQVNYPANLQSLEEIRLFIIYITSALIVF